MIKVICEECDIKLGTFKNMLVNIEEIKNELVQQKLSIENIQKKL